MSKLTCTTRALRKLFDHYKWFKERYGAFGTHQFYNSETGWQTLEYYISGASRPALLDALSNVFLDDNGNVKVDVDVEWAYALQRMYKSVKFDALCEGLKFRKKFGSFIQYTSKMGE